MYLYLGLIYGIQRLSGGGREQWKAPTQDTTVKYKVYPSSSSGTDLGRHSALKVIVCVRKSMLVQLPRSAMGFCLGRTFNYNGR